MCFNMINKFTLENFFSFTTEIQVYYNNMDFDGPAKRVSRSTSCKSLRGCLLYFIYIKTYINTKFYFSFILIFNF